MLKRTLCATKERQDEATLDPEDLPYLKRWPYKDEKEFRIVYWSNKYDGQTRTYPITLSSIKHLTLSPWMNKSLTKAVIQTIKGISGCGGLKISASTLIENESWKSLTEKCDA